MSINPGYWTFNMLAKKFKSIGKITLEMTPENEKCVIESDKDKNLKNLGLLLGFTKKKLYKKIQVLRVILWLISTVDYVIYQYAVTQ